MGRLQQQKGYRGENNLRKLFVNANIECIRVPLSGAAPGTDGDLIINGGDKAEVKIRGNGFKQLYDWISDNHYLFVKADRKDYLAVMRIDDFIKLLSGNN